MHARTRCVSAQPAAKHPQNPDTHAELVLALALLILAVATILLPALPLPQGYHDFVDQRALLGLPNAADVLSNLAFALMAILGWRQLRRVPDSRLDTGRRILVQAFLAGLLLTTFTSSFYHLAPGDAALAVDRLGIGVAFTGLLGLATADRIRLRAGLILAVVIALAAPAAAWWNAHNGNMTPWAMLQGGGLLLLLVLAGRRLQPGALGFSLLAVVGWYALAKGLELADAPVFAWSQGLISGHSAKHLVAALAAWPVLTALRRAANSQRVG